MKANKTVKCNLEIRLSPDNSSEASSRASAGGVVIKYFSIFLIATSELRSSSKRQQSIDFERFISFCPVLKKFYPLLFVLDSSANYLHSPCHRTHNIDKFI